MTKSRDVLVYSITKANRKTVRRHYLEYRASNGLPIRCDLEVCAFYSQPLTWNGKPFSPILDHTNGNSLDNRPANLRLLCPNCDSQQETRGGLNRGRVQNKAAQGYEIAHRDGRRDANIFPVGLVVTASLGHPIVSTPHADHSGVDPEPSVSANGVTSTGAQQGFGAGGG